MDGEVTLDWTIPNLITVTLMVLIGFAAAGFVSRMFRGTAANGPAMADKLAA